ncbi:MAG TPA: hypothetical protein VN893_02720 [Bryobacteraceae bacterium]|nr:hypothetical protein [Bryobacteraceae bacterium]
MDLYKTIQILHTERERLTKLIAYLEHLKTSKAEQSRRKPQSRRGRKRMSEAERREVSDRMKKYWAARKGPAGGGKASAPDEPQAPPTAVTA